MFRQSPFKGTFFLFGVKHFSLPRRAKKAQSMSISVPIACPGRPFSNLASTVPFLPCGLVISPIIFFPEGVVHSTFLPFSFCAASLFVIPSGMIIILLVSWLLAPRR